MCLWGQAGPSGHGLCRSLRQARDGRGPATLGPAGRPPACFRALTVQLAPQRLSLLRLVLVAVVVCRSHHRRLHRAPGAVRRDSPAVHAKCHRPGLLTRTSHAKVQPNLCFLGAASQAPSITCQLHEVCPLQVPPSYHSFSGFIDLKSFLYLRVSLRKRACELRLLISFQHTLK